MVSADFLRALGPDGLFINVARASIVDEDALVAAVKSGRIAGAGLEVFDPALGLPTALEGLRNVILSPHIGSATRQARGHGGRCSPMCAPPWAAGTTRTSPSEPPPYFCGQTRGNSGPLRESPGASSGRGR
jgi:lactate dehydrogenase-like 2-hydroxyacid dehydrogenase